MTKKKDIAGLFKLVLIASVFFAPLILATWLYVSGTGFRPEGKTNHGEILQPLINIRDVLPDCDCDAACEYALYTLRQSRLMLGKEMDRLVRVFLHGDTAPDTVFLANEHAGLITLRDNDFSDLLENKKPAELSDGGYYLVDPLGNLVMYFRPDIDPGDMVEDIKHLLELSRIG
jgi:hypothetical protein